MAIWTGHNPTDGPSTTGQQKKIPTFPLSIPIGTMAQETKIISCPQCGSSSQEQIVTNQYRCSNCLSEYYLDNDDININVRYINAPETKTLPSKKKVWVSTILGFVLTIIFLAVFFVLKLGHADSGTTISIDYNFEGIAGFGAATDQKPTALMIGIKNNPNKNNKQDNVIAVFYDLTDNKEIRSEQIGLSIDGSRGADYRLKTFANGSLYAILGGSNLYKINKTTLSLASLAPVLSSFEALRIGIAKAEFMLDEDGWCRLMTNDGKTFYYCPDANKLHTDDEFEKILQSTALLDNLKEGSYFTFPYTSGSDKVERLPLVKIRYRYNEGRPTNMPTIWSSDIPGLFTGNPMKGNSNIIYLTDFTPDRNYFDAAVLLADNDEVIIKFRPDINPNTPVAVQSLNAVTAAVNWTYTLKGNGIDQDDTEYVQDIVKTPVNYILNIRNLELVLLGKDGRFMNMLKKYRER